MGERVLMKGNEAFAEAAIRSGCRFYFGYPITPQNEVTEFMARELAKYEGGRFVQAESEIAAVNMAYGAAGAGGRVLISSASPGVALMQEGLSFITAANLPLVLLNVSRGGPGIGSIQPGQADYYQATRGGGNGDYHLVVLAPSSIQESVDLMSVAFDIADKYQNPVMLLTDGMLGQMMEPVTLPEPKQALITAEEIATDKPWAITGHGGKRDRQVVKALHLQPETLEQTIIEREKKYDAIRKDEVRYETVGLEEAEIVLVAYGSTARISLEAIEILGEQGIKAGLIRPITLWPFPDEAFDKIQKSTKMLMSVELSQGQMVGDIQIASKAKYQVGLSKRVGGMLLTPQQIAEDVKKALGVK